MNPSSFSADTPVAWGSVGSSNVWGYLAERSERGVVRTVEPNVSYARPPQCVEHAWTSLEDQLDRYEMPWERNPTETVRTLADLGEALRKKQSQGPLPANDTDLAELDTAGVQLLRLMDKLREAGWRPGLLHPRNVLVPRGQGGLKLLLPDLGFVWEGGMMMPAWVSDKEFTALYDGDPATVQKSALGGRSLDPIDPKADLPHLARLLACVLTGTPRHDLVRPEAVAPAAGSRPGPTTRDRLWDLLVRAGRREMGSLDEFASRLTNAQLRSHFVPQRIPDSTPLTTKTSPLPVVLGILTLLLVGVAAVLFWRPWEAGPQVASTGAPGGTETTATSRPATGPRSPATNSGKRPTGTSPKPGPKLTGPGPDWVVKLRTAAPTELSKLFESALGASVSAEDRQRNRQAFFGDWKSRLTKLLEESRDQNRFFTAVDGLKHLYQEMTARKSVSATPLDAEEKRCLADLQVYLAQLGFLQ